MNARLGNGGVRTARTGSNWSPAGLTIATCPDCGADGIMIGVHTPAPRACPVHCLPGRRKVHSLVGRDPESGRTIPFLKHWVNREYCGSPEQVEYVERIVNRMDNSYVEICYHPMSGEVVFKNAGRRDDQSMHGPRGKRSA
jgi:hypothetical protein